VRVVTARSSRAVDVQSGRDVGEPVPNPHAFPQTTWRLSALSPGARFLIVGDRKEIWEAWDFSAGGPPRVVTLPGSAPAVWFEFSPEGNFLVFRSSPRALSVVDLRTGQLVGPPVVQEHETLGAWTVALGADGRFLVAAYQSGNMGIWDVRTGRMIRALERVSRGAPSFVNLSSDGERVMVTTTLGEARIWDLATGRPASPPFEVAPGGAGESVTPGGFFSPDNRWFATVGSQRTTVHDAKSFAPAGSPISIRPLGPWSMYFNHDGTRLVTGSRIWDVPGGELIADLADEPQVRRRGLSGLEFSPDGDYILYQINGAAGPVAQVRSIPPALSPGGTIPDWLLDLATLIAGRTIDEAEQSVALSEARISIDDVRRQLANLPGNAPYAAWGRWILDDRPDRPIAPGFTISVEEAEKRAAAIE
jgi:WD40 repeat protein